ncbi:MFS transporter permease [Macrococcoides canis]|nr:MFS transporter permease [Macrococcus canis]
MKKYALILFSIIAISVLGYAFITKHPAQSIMFTFLAIGFGLALLRIFVNNTINKMKGKPIGVKILFFAILLGIGLPFQNWFRINVLMTIKPDFIVYCVILLVCSMVVTTLTVQRINIENLNKILLNKRD